MGDVSIFFKSIYIFINSFLYFTNNSNSIVPDASELGLNYLQFSLLWNVRLKGVNFNRQLQNQKRF